MYVVFSHVWVECWHFSSTLAPSTHLLLQLTLWYQPFIFWICYSKSVYQEWMLYRSTLNKYWFSSFCINLVTFTSFQHMVSTITMLADVHLWVFLGFMTQDETCCFQCSMVCVCVCLSVCLSVGHNHEPYKNSCSNRSRCRLGCGLQWVQWTMY